MSIKLWKWVLAGVGVVVAIVVITMITAVHLHGKAPIRIEPLTFIELEKISGPDRSRSERAPVLNQKPVATSATLTVISPAHQNENIPVRLRRAPTREERQAFFKPDAPTGYIQFKAGIAKGFEASLWLFDVKGFGGGINYDLGYMLPMLGQFDDAKNYYYKVLRAPGVNLLGKQLAYSRLAWLEDDPELATQMMRLAVEGDVSGGYIPLAMELCLATGSNELAEQIMSDYRKLNPSMADDFEKNQLPKIRLRHDR